MRFDIIVGCMYSGKTTELIRRLTRYQSINKKVLCINHEIDTRSYDYYTQTHSGQKFRAIKISSLRDILKFPEYHEADVIGIDEGQFFNDLIDFVYQCEKDNKDLIVSSLDGDFQRKPIGQIAECIPLCNTITKLEALDMESRDLTPAIFTKRISDSKEQILVGSTEHYIAVSRENYLK